MSQLNEELTNKNEIRLPYFDGFKGTKCVVRCNRSGVFYGTFQWLEGTMCLITDVQNIWYWAGAATVLQLATDGVALPNETKISIKVSSLVVTDAVEIVPCTEKAIKCLDSISPWTA